MFQKPAADLHQTYAVDPINDHDDVETVVGPSVHVEGDFSSEGNIVVKGIVSGTVQTIKRLTVESGAKIFANVRAGVAVISGEIKGNVKAADRVEVTSTARIVGDIECQSLAVEAGALLYGKVTMKGIDIDSPKQARKSSSKKLQREEDESDAEDVPASLM